MIIARLAWRIFNRCLLNSRRLVESYERLLFTSMMTKGWIFNFFKMTPSLFREISRDWKPRLVDPPTLCLTETRTRTTFSAVTTVGTGVPCQRIFWIQFEVDGIFGRYTRGAKLKLVLKPHPIVSKAPLFLKVISQQTNVIARSTAACWIIYQISHSSFLWASTLTWTHSPF